MKKTLMYGILYLLPALLTGMSLGAAPGETAERMRLLLERSRTYEFGQSRILLMEIQDQIASVYESPEELKKAESVLLSSLQSDSSFALKDFICRQLSVIGTEQSVPVLIQMLDDEKTAGPALYALVRISSAAADEALMKAVSDVRKPVRIGILSALGFRKTSAAAAVIAPLLGGDDPEETAAALSALGQIGTAEAAQALQENATRIPISLRPRLDDALLSCGETLLEKGDKNQAKDLFETVYKSGSSDLARTAALGGLVRSTTSSEAETVLLKALNSSDLQMQTAALRLACQRPDEKVAAEALKKMPGYNPLIQIRFLAALGEFKSPYAKEAALGCLDSESSEVRLAAFETLCTAGDRSCVMPLARAAAAASDRGQREAARQALSRLPDKGADQVIIEGIEKADLSSEREAEVGAELIRAAGQRNIRSALPAVLQAASAENRIVRRESLGTLQIISEPTDLPQLATLLTKPDSEIEKTLVIAALKAPARKGRGRAILSFFEDTQDEALRAAVYRVLGQIGDPDTLDALRGDLWHSKNPAVQKAVFRGLTEWPGPEVMEDMKRFITQGEDEPTRVLAFRAYVRMLRQSGMEPDKLSAALVSVMSLAPRPSENKAVLAALGEQACEQALVAAVKNLENETLRAEAQAAVVGICEKLVKQQPVMCKTALTKLLDSTPNEVLVNRAKELLEDLH